MPSMIAIAIGHQLFVASDSNEGFMISNQRFQCRKMFENKKNLVLRQPNRFRLLSSTKTEPKFSVTA